MLARALPCQSSSVLRCRPPSVSNAGVASSGDHAVAPQGESAMVARPAHRLSPSCTDLTSMLVC
eukprot:12172843-Alexandrium_andersonii.AAC.1